MSDRFLKCFDSTDVDLDGRVHLSETLSFFRQGDAAGVSPFARDSLASMVGRTALWLREGSPSPLERELEAISPAFSVVMFGTNDVGIYGVIDFADYLLLSVDQMLRLGVLPVLTTIPPRNDLSTVNADVPTPPMRIMLSLLNLLERFKRPAKSYPAKKRKGLAKML